MKPRDIVVLSILSAILLLSACSGGDIEKKGLVRVSKHCYAYIADGPSTSEGLGSNSGFVVGERGVLVVDSRFTPHLADQLLKAIRSVTDKPILYLVNTHYHPDHTWGNEVFKKEGAVIVARQETAEGLKKYSPIYKEYYKSIKPRVYSMIKDVRVVLPDSFIGDYRMVELGGVQVSVEYRGPSHTAGDLVVVVPSEGIVYTGGILVNGYHPNMGDPGADLGNWVGVLKGFLEMNVRHFVPAQGYVCGSEVVRDNIEYITGLEEQCERLITDGRPLKEALEEVRLPLAEGYLQANILPFNISSVYRKRALGLVNPRFKMKLPASFVVMDGAGSSKAGMLRWGVQDSIGYREIEVNWQPTHLGEVIKQDVSERVSRYLIENKDYKMEITASGGMDIAGGRCPYLEGRWGFKRETGKQGGGMWAWTLAISDGTLYSIRMMTDAALDEDSDRKNLDQLKAIAATLSAK